MEVNVRMIAHWKKSNGDGKNKWLVLSYSSKEMTLSVWILWNQGIMMEIDVGIVADWNTIDGKGKHKYSGCRVWHDTNEQRNKCLEKTRKHVTARILYSSVIPVPTSLFVILAPSITPVIWIFDLFVADSCLPSFKSLCSFFTCLSVLGLCLLLKREMLSHSLDQIFYVALLSFPWACEAYGKNCNIVWHYIVWHLLIIVL